MSIANDKSATNTFESLELRYAHSATPFTSDAAMMVVNTTPFRGDVMALESIPLIVESRGQYTPILPTANSDHPLNAILDPYEMTDDEAMALYSLPIADFPPVRK